MALCSFTANSEHYYANNLKFIKYWNCCNFKNFSS